MIYKTESGLYSVDMATNRARLPIIDQKLFRNLALISVMNVILTTVTMFNIKTERAEKTLIEKEKKRMLLEELANAAAAEGEGGQN